MIKQDKRKRRGFDHPNTKHGLACTPTYYCWQAMLRRCYNNKYFPYEYYGGIGIRVCGRLRKSIVEFVSVVGIKPRDLQIDRINNALHYSCGQCQECKREGWPMNLRWETRKKQCRNRRSSVMIKVGREIKTAAEWAELKGVRHHIVYNAAKRGRFGTVVSAKWL